MLKSEVNKGSAINLFCRTAGPVIQVLLICPVRLDVDTFPKVVRKDPVEPRVRRRQRDDSLRFNLAVVGEVGRGELSYKQAQRR